MSLALVALLAMATTVAVCGEEAETDGAMNDMDADTEAEDELADAAANNLFEVDFETALEDMSEYFPLDVDYALGVGQFCDPVAYNSSYYSVVGLVIACIMVVLGVIFAFFGYRLIKLNLFLIGFLIGGGLAYFLVLAFTFSIDETWVFYVAASVALVVGLLCGLLTILVYYVGVFLVGFTIGLLITWIILSLIDVDFFQEYVWVPVVIAIVAGIVIGIICLKFLQKWFFMLGTTILGSIMIVWGLDYFLELGAMMYYLFLFASDRGNLEPCWFSWLVIPVLVLLLVAAFLVQALVTGRKYDHKKQLKDICCGLCSKNKRKKKRTEETRGLLKDETED